MIKFKDVAHHYIGCKLIAPISFYEGFETNLVGSNHTNSFKNGIELSSIQQQQFPDAKPVLRPIEELTEEIINRDYAEKIVKEYGDAHETKDALRCTAAIINKMCKDGFDLFGLIDSKEAISIREYEK